MFASAKLVKGGKKEKELDVVEVRSWYMEHVIQLDLDRAYLPVRDILLQPDREISVKLRGKKNRSGKGNPRTHGEEIMVTRMFRYLGSP